MNPPESRPLSVSAQAGLFPQTQWSVIANAQAGETGEALAALDRLARAYWRPLYAYVRGGGMDHERAADEVQGFFASLLARDSLREIQPGATRFRSFLLACLQNWMASSARRELALKRGGGKTPEPLHELASDVIPPAPEAALPEEALDRTWAVEVFERAFARLEEDAQRRGRAEAFAVLRPVLRGAEVEGGFAALGATLDVAEGTARKMAFDLRVRLGEFLRDEVLETVASPADADEELRYLVGLL